MPWLKFKCAYEWHIRICYIYWMFPFGKKSLNWKFIVYWNAYNFAHGQMHIYDDNNKSSRRYNMCGGGGGGGGRRMVKEEIDNDILT